MTLLLRRLLLATWLSESLFLLFLLSPFLLSSPSLLSLPLLHPKSLTIYENTSEINLAHEVNAQLGQLGLWLQGGIRGHVVKDKTVVSLGDSEAEVVVELSAGNLWQGRIPLKILARPFLESAQFFPQNQTLHLHFSLPVHSSPHLAARQGELHPSSVSISLFSQQGTLLALATIKETWPISPEVFAFRIDFPLRQHGTETLKIHPNPTSCFDAQFPHGAVAQTTVEISMVMKDVIEPWWLCASLFYQQVALDVLESVTYSAPYGSPYGSPAKLDLPLGGMAKLIANRVFETEKASFGGNDRWAVKQVEISHDCHSAARHARVLASVLPGSKEKGEEEAPQEVWLSVEHDDKNGLSFSRREITRDRIVFITAVSGREDRLRRMIQLLREMARDKRAQSEGPFAVCMANYEGNQYDMRELLSVLPVQQYVVDMPGVFKKAPGLQRCVDLLHDSDIAFVLDVDIEADSHLLKNIRRAVTKGVSFFAPIVNYENVDNNGTLFKDSPAGYATMGTGILGAYVADIRRVGGYDIEKFGQFHGWEDTDFFFRLRHSLMQVVRFRENRLVHVPHPREGIWANSSTRRTEELFGCQKVGKRLDLLAAGFDKHTSTMTERVHFQPKGAPDSPKSGTVLQKRAEGLLVRLDRDGNTIWISPKDLAYMDTLFLPHHAIIEGTLEPHERYWLDHLLSSKPGEPYFQSNTSPREGDSITITFPEPLRLGLREVVVVKTGHPHHPNKFLRAGILRLHFGPGKVNSFRFVNGVAVGRVGDLALPGGSGEGLLEKVEIVVRKSQKEVLVIQAIKLG